MPPPDNGSGEGIPLSEQETLSMAAAPSPRSGAPQLKPGDRLARRFVIVQFLARGGMGEIYEAADDHLQGKRCALKTLRREIASDSSIRQRFEREVLLAREVVHPNVCPTYDLFREEAPEGPLLFLTMKLLRGESLAALLKRSGPLTVEQALPIIRQMAAGLNAAHQAGVIHRDFKPGNVMIEAGDGELRVSITDFGISRFYESDTTLAETGQIVGTIGYIAPELFYGATASPASDVYALGVVVYEMLTGRKPESAHEKPGFARSSVAKGLPREWERFLRGCLQYDPGKRFQSAGAALEQIGVPHTAGSRTRVRELPRRRWLAGSIASALAAAGIWTGWGRIDSLVHPLPQQRFVAVLAWPPGSVSAEPTLLRTMLDSMRTRLTRAEAADKNLIVVSSGESAEAALKNLSEVISSLGANLVLGATLRSLNSGYQVEMRVLEASTGRALRQQTFSLAFADLSQLGERAAVAAATLLNAPKLPALWKDADELKTLSPSEYQLFSEASELEGRPNNAGLDPAIEKFQNIVNAAPRFALGYASLARAYSNKYFSTQDPAWLSLATKNADAAVQLNPESARGLQARATVAMYAGRMPDAVNDYARALQLDPGNPEILLSKARVFRNLARPAEEEQVYREIIRSRPNFWRAYNELGSVLYRQGKYREAAEAFGEASAVAPRVALPLANQGTMYALLGDDKAAEEAFRRSLQRAPNEFAYSNLGSILFKRGDYKGALSFYEKARDLNPKAHQRWRNLADCYAALGDQKREIESYDNAAAMLSATLKINPNPGVNWATLAFYHAKLGRRQDAETDLNAADEHGLDQRGQFMKVQALAVLGRKSDALQLLLKCIDEGLSPVDVELAVDLRDLRSDPRYRARVSGVH